jgi:hypothetical protein
MRQAQELLQRRFVVCIVALVLVQFSEGCGEPSGEAPLTVQMPLGIQQQFDADVLISFFGWDDLWVDHGPGTQQERVAGVHDWGGLLTWLKATRIKRDFVVVCLGKTTFGDSSWNMHVHSMWRDLKALGVNRFVVHRGTSTLMRKTGFLILWDSAEGAEHGETRRQ